MLPLFVAVACCLCLALAAASCQVFKSLGGSQTVVPPRLELGLGSVRPVSLSLPLSLSISLPLFLLEWHLISMMSLFHLQLKNYAKCNRSRGAETAKETSTKQRLQAKDVTASDGRVYQVNGYLRHTLTLNTHNLNKNEANFFRNSILLMVLIPN